MDVSHIRELKQMKKYINYFQQRMWLTPNYLSLLPVLIQYF